MTYARKRTLLIFGLLLPILTLLAGCSCKHCEQEQDRFLGQWGEPEETELSRSGHLLTETWYYWEDSRTVVFFWDDRDCACDVSTYTFTPAEREGAEPGEEPEPALTLHFRTARTNPFRP